MSEMGGGGIYLIGGDRKTLTPGGHYAENNHIHHYGRWDRVYRPAIHISGVGLRTSTQSYSRCAARGDSLRRAGVSFRIQRDPQRLPRVARLRRYLRRAELVLCRATCFGTTTCTISWGKDGGACRGIYLDDEFSGALIQGNIFHQVYQAVFLGGGRDNLVENNIFVDCPKAFHVDRPRYRLGRLCGESANSKGARNRSPLRRPLSGTALQHTLPQTGDDAR